MSISVIVEIYADTGTTSPIVAKATAQRIEAAVEKAARTPSSFRGGTWLWPPGGSYAVGGLFKFGRSLSAPVDIEANGIVNAIRRGIASVVGQGALTDVRLYVTDDLPFYGGEAGKSRPRRQSRRSR